MLPPSVPRFWICTPPISRGRRGEHRHWRAPARGEDLGVGRERADRDAAAAARCRAAREPPQIEEARGLAACRSSGRRRRRCSRRAASSGLAAQQPQRVAQAARPRQRQAATPCGHGRASWSRVRRAAARRLHGLLDGAVDRCSRCSGTGCRPAPRAIAGGAEPRRSGSAAMIMPGVQMPHCAPPSPKRAAADARRGGGQPFDRRDVRARRPARPAPGRVDRRAVDQHRAGAALAFAAAFLGAGEPAVLAQHVEQPLHRRARRPAARAVQREAHHRRAAGDLMPSAVSASRPAAGPPRGLPPGSAPASPGSRARRSRRGGAR